MEKITIGILREGKIPPDKRVPLTPEQCKLLETVYPGVKVIVQPSEDRAFKDQEYLDNGVELKEDLKDCDVILGVKEVNISDLIPNKKFMFFSHTIKKQPYNRDLLKAVIDNNIQLIDYELLKDKSNKRIIGFGRYAGVVGCYNGFRAYGIKHRLYSLKAAHECINRVQVEDELNKVELPADTRIVLSGFGRVGHGAREILDLLPIKEVSPEEFINKEFDTPVYTHLEAEDYNTRRDGAGFDKKDFYSSPYKYKSTFSKYLSKTDMYITCHYWSNKADVIITREDLKSSDLRLSVVADISCDIDCAIACTIRPSTIDDPIYGYNPITESEDDFMKSGTVAVMAVDNLPCELPLDASEDFGRELLKEVFPALLNKDSDNIIERGSETTLEGRLSDQYLYLEDYLEGRE
jgi:alanine dehydrogenase